MEAEPGFDGTGCDSVRFLMSANAGEAPGRISRIASGGELARIMLVMKDVLTERAGAETLVFDEMTRAFPAWRPARGGEARAHIAHEAGDLRDAPAADSRDGGRALPCRETRVWGQDLYGRDARWDREGRVRELARLHGGDNITDTTLASAAEQLDAACEYKKEGKENDLRRKSRRTEKHPQLRAERGRSPGRADRPGRGDGQAASSAFGGGLRCGEACGAYAGAVLCLGMTVGADGMGKPGGPVAIAAKELADEFKAKFGAIRCSDLMDLSGGDKSVCKRLLRLVRRPRRRDGEGSGVRPGRITSAAGPERTGFPGNKITRS